MKNRLQTLVDQGVVIYGHTNKIIEMIKSAMPLLMCGAIFMDAQRRRNPDDSLTHFLSEPQTVLMLAATAMSLVMISLYTLFLPRNASVQADHSVDLGTSFKSSSSSTLFMQLVKSRDSLNHICRITSEKIDDFIKQVAPYFIMLFSTATIISNTPSFIQEINNPEKRSIFLVSYLINAAIIFGAVQDIRHSKSHEPRRKECETQVDETL